ncbi:Pentatricopeptide repeat-containing protein [Diplonema papillatum]|nr:Pentatricopeptide repeat-containing protein [Diplonema papillatum]
MKASLALLQDMMRDNVGRTEATYEHLVDCSARAANVEATEQVLGHMKSDGIRETPRVWLSLLRLYSKAHDQRSLSVIWDTMLGQDVQPGPLAWALMMAGQVNYADGRAIFEEMLSGGVQAKPKHFQALLRAAACGGNVDDAERLFCKMKDGTWVDDFVHVIPAVATAKEGTVLPRQPMPVRTELCNALLSVYSRKGLTISVKRFFKEREADDGFEANNITYTFVVEAYAAALRDQPKAKQRLKGEMELFVLRAQSQGIVSCRRLYTAVMQCYGHLGDVSAARALRDVAHVHGVHESTVFLRNFALVFQNAGVPPRPSELDRRDPNTRAGGTAGSNSGYIMSGVSLQ